LEDIAGVALEYPVTGSAAKALDDDQEFRWLPHLSQVGGAFPCGALSGGSDTATPPLALSGNQAEDESSLFSKSATAKFKISPPLP